MSTRRNRRHAFGLAPDVHGRIKDDDCDLAVWIRRAPAAAKRFVRFCPSALLPDLTFSCRIDVVRAAVRNAIHPGAGDGRAFADDVAMLAERFGAATGATRVRVRIERVTNDGCRLFHVDRVKVRLVCTYRGAGTEWLPESALSRDGLKKGSNADIVRLPHGVRRMRPWAVALMKGALATGAPDSGVVHRSPPVAAFGDTRLVVVIDDADVAYR